MAVWYRLTGAVRKLLFDNRGFFAKAWSRGGSLQEGRSGGRIVESISGAPKKWVIQSD